MSKLVISLLVERILIIIRKIFPVNQKTTTADATDGSNSLAVMKAQKAAKLKALAEQAAAAAADTSAAAPADASADTSPP